MEKIAIGSDHGGINLKKFIKKNFSNFEWFDTGTHSSTSVDYPDFAAKVVQEILQKKVKQGILICRSGIGMAIAANRYRGIYAALCFNEVMAESAREHNNANILCLAADHVGNDSVIKIVRQFLESKFTDEERHVRRLKKLDLL